MIALRAEDYGKLERIVDVCEKAGVHTKMIPDFGNVISTRPYIGGCAGDSGDSCPQSSTEYHAEQGGKEGS